MPALDTAYRPVASIGARGPTTRLAGEKPKDTVRLLNESAQRISGEKKAAGSTSFLNTPLVAALQLILW